MPAEPAAASPRMARAPNHRYVATMRRRPASAVAACLLAAALLPAQSPATTARAPFSPAEHGFRFSNTFQNDAVPLLDLRTGGLCGGMSYTALDYWSAGLPIPTVDHRPANGTPLHQYIYLRQIDSLVRNVLRWGELYADVRGARRAEFFRRGLDAGERGELGRLQKALARGAPIPLGLKAPRGPSHQVLALGCEVGPGPDDVALRLYDPNFPGRTMTMVPDVARLLWVYRGGPQRVQWTSWFTDDHYAPKVPTVPASPPWPADGLVHVLLVECTLGHRDLAGAGEDLDAEVQFADGTTLQRPRINLGARWLSDYQETAEIELPRGVPAAALRGLTLRLAQPPVGDGCDLPLVRVRARGRDLDVRLGNTKGGALSPAHPALDVPLAPPR